MRRKISIALLIAAAALFVSCASEKDTRLVADPDEKKESTLPWNKQEKWEQQGGQGQMANMMEGRR